VGARLGTLDSADGSRRYQKEVCTAFPVGQHHEAVGGRTSPHQRYAHTRPGIVRRPPVRQALLLRNESQPVPRRIGRSSRSTKPIGAHQEGNDNTEAHRCSRRGEAIVPSRHPSRSYTGNYYRNVSAQNARAEFATGVTSAEQLEGIEPTNRLSMAPPHKLCYVACQSGSRTTRDV
jgi:hypothetical protein